MVGMTIPIIFPSLICGNTELVKENLSVDSEKNYALHGKDFMLVSICPGLSQG